MRRKIGYGLFALFVLVFAVTVMLKIARDRDAAIDGATGAVMPIGGG